MSIGATPLATASSSADAPARPTIAATMRKAKASSPVAGMRLAASSLSTTTMPSAPAICALMALAEKAHRPRDTTTTLPDTAASFASAPQPSNGSASTARREPQGGSSPKSACSHRTPLRCGRCACVTARLPPSSAASAAALASRRIASRRSSCATLWKRSSSVDDGVHDGGDEASRTAAATSRSVLPAMGCALMAVRRSPTRTHPVRSTDSGRPLPASRRNASTRRLLSSCSPSCGGRPPSPSSSTVNS
mmetsp:Transcript_2629/g.9119  ORF Transcript_2629/g.9119 Transcript_2629/m.9119 type:complete len:250 (+) Transcript_2629:1019-1768(+)